MTWHRLIWWTLVEAPCIILSDRPGGLGLTGPGLYYLLLFIYSRICQVSLEQFVTNRDGNSWLNAAYAG
jgi:hypothetical protein